MRKAWVLTEEAFNGLLDWLDQDPEQAALKYEKIRRKLIRIFVGRGSYVAEELADETFNRVAEKIPALQDYQGEKVLYFYGVARWVQRESLRKETAKTQVDTIGLSSEPDPNPNEDDHRLLCLQGCLKDLSEDNRNLFLEYYCEERKAKIKHRKRLAAELGIAINALRIRAYRIRIRLKQCVNNCLEHEPAH